MIGDLNFEWWQLERKGGDGGVGLVAGRVGRWRGNPRMVAAKVNKAKLIKQNRIN